MEQLISDLLLRHNCVVLPTFGGFVTKKIAATIDFKTGVMLPPRKSLLFNKLLVNNDGLLINHFAHENRLDYASAERAIQEKVGLWQNQLSKGESIVIDKVGRLYLDQERNVCFEQDRFFNLLLDAYGLGKVHFLSEQDLSLAKQEVRIDEKIEQRIAADLEIPVIIPINTAPDFEKAPIIEHPATASVNSKWKYIAAALLIPIGFYSFWIPVKTDVLESGIITLQDFNPFHSNKKVKLPVTTPKEDKKTVKQKKISVENEQVNSISNDHSNQEENEITNEIPESKKEIPVTEIKTQNADFEVIVGCFSNIDNAQNVVQFLKSNGFDAQILDFEDGMQRVSAGSAVNTADAKLIQQKSNEVGYPAWILKK